MVFWVNDVVFDFVGDDCDDLVGVWVWEMLWWCGDDECVVDFWVVFDCVVDGEFVCYEVEIDCENID